MRISLCIGNGLVSLELSLALGEASESGRLSCGRLRYLFTMPLFSRKSPKSVDALNFVVLKMALGVTTHEHEGDKAKAALWQGAVSTIAASSDVRDADRALLMASLRIGMGGWGGTDADPVELDSGLHDLKVNLLTLFPSPIEAVSLGTTGMLIAEALVGREAGPEALDDLDPPERALTEGLVEGWRGINDALISRQQRQTELVVASGAIVTASAVGAMLMSP